LNQDGFFEQTIDRETSASVPEPVQKKKAKFDAA
jgi:hypothetical protein